MGQCLGLLGAAQLSVEVGREERQISWHTSDSFERSTWTSLEFISAGSDGHGG